MIEILWMLRGYIVQFAGFVLVFFSVISFLIVKFGRSKKGKPKTEKSKFNAARNIAGVFIAGILFIVIPTLSLRVFEIPPFLNTFGPAEGPSLPIGNIFEFLWKAPDFAATANIARDPNDVPAPITRTSSAMVKVRLEIKEVIAEIAPGVYQNFWTFNGTVPGPLLRVREGDTVELTLYNNPNNIHHHSIDLHAVTGPGGGAVVTNVAPGESKTFSFMALHPGLFVYHCAAPNVAVHMAHGMYGMILVEPKSGLPAVDKELYVMQGEFYNGGNVARGGLQIFNAQKMLDGIPGFVVFNGKVGSIEGNVHISTGRKVRIYFGNGGVNLISSFHVIGEVFDDVYPEAAITNEPLHHVQTTTVPAGGATVVDFGVEVPGNYMLVDHALARMDKGAYGMIKVDGPEDKTIFNGVASGNSGGH